MHIYTVTSKDGLTELIRLLIVSHLALAGVPQQNLHCIAK
jgi:hypothetical protein